MEYNIYCDESCHLNHSESKVMVMGAVTCPIKVREKVCREIDDIKLKHKLDRDFEIKWSKVGKKKVNFYLDIINYFFTETTLKYDGLVVMDREDTAARFSTNNGDDTLWYYSLYYLLLDNCVDSKSVFNIYIDIKDTRGGSKVRALHNALCSNIYDFKKKCIKKIQLINSKESNIIQLADLLSGALSYYNRNEETIDVTANNQGKVILINRIKKLTGLSLSDNAIGPYNRFNLLVVGSNDNEE